MIHNMLLTMSRRNALVAIIALSWSSVAFQSDLKTGATTMAVNDPPPINFYVHPERGRYQFDPIMFSPAGTVRFVATLRNVSPQPIAVSSFGIGNVSIWSVEVAGKAILPNITEVDFEADPRLGAQSALISLNPGQETMFTIVGLSTFVIRAGSPVRHIEYSPRGLGKYHVEFQYQYTGPDNAIPNVFHGALTAKNVSFYVD